MFFLIRKKSEFLSISTKVCMKMKGRLVIHSSTITATLYKLGRNLNVRDLLLNLMDDSENFGKPTTDVRFCVPFKNLPK